MRKFVVIISAAAFMAVSVITPAISSPGCCGGAPKKTEIKCPVMGGVIKDIKKADKSIYKGKTYYFCCAGCKPKFDKNPGKYIKKKA